MRRLRQSLAAQLVAAQLLVIVLVLLAVSAVSVEQTRLEERNEQSRRVLALAENLAANPLVRAIPVAEAGRRLTAAAAQLQSTTGADVVLLATSDLQVVAGTDTLLFGQTVDWPALAGAPERSATALVTLDGQRYQLAAAPVFGEQVEVNVPVAQLGVALVGEADPTRADALRTAAPALLTYLGAALVIGVIGSLLMARWIKRQTLGMEPAEIVALAEQREAVFAGIAEGVLALDVRQRVTLANPVAVQLLSLPATAVGSSLDELGVTGRLRDVLTGDDGGERDAVVIRSGKVLVLNRMPVRMAGRDLGSVTTLRDRTAFAELERELGAFRGTADLLRAQTHEFANQLHTISGLIQIGDYAEVVGYVDALTRSRAAVDLTVARRVHDRSVAALLVAQSAVAAERRVELRVSSRTHLGPLSAESAFDLSTVLGNLIGNGIDAVTGDPDPSGERWVEVEIRQAADSVELTVRDSGPGVDATIATEVFEHGFTTKAARDGDRGIGLALTRLVCRRRAGEVVVRATEHGAEFVARMRIEPAAAVDTVDPGDPGDPGDSGDEPDSGVAATSAATTGGGRS